jgi:hypothetical protein
MTVIVLVVTHFLAVLIGMALAYSILKKESPLVEQVTKLETKIETGVKEATEKAKELETEVVKMSAVAKTKVEEKEKRSKKRANSDKA